MSFLYEDVPTLDAMRATVMAETQTATMLSSQIEQQGRTFWDNIFSITIYSFAIVASSRALNSSSFFTLLAIFGGLMYVIIHIKGMFSPGAVLI
jgi:hypothetical protein